MDDNVTIQLQCVCPRCGKTFDRELTLPAMIASVVKGLKNILCNSCGNKKKTEDEKRWQNMQVADEDEE